MAFYNSWWPFVDLDENSSEECQVNYFHVNHSSPTDDGICDIFIYADDMMLFSKCDKTCSKMWHVGKVWVFFWGGFWS